MEAIKEMKAIKAIKAIRIIDSRSGKEKARLLLQPWDKFILPQSILFLISFEFHLTTEGGCQS